MSCPIKLVPCKCDKCLFGKDGLCDYPYAGARRLDTMKALHPSAKAAKAAFRQRFDEIKGDIASGRINFYNTPEWTEKLLNITALNCALVRIHEEAKWN